MRRTTSITTLTWDELLPVVLVYGIIAALHSPKAVVLITYALAFYSRSISPSTRTEIWYDHEVIQKAVA